MVIFFADNLTRKAQKKATEPMRAVKPTKPVRRKMPDKAIMPDVAEDGGA